MKQRLLSLLLCGAMLFSMCTPGLALERASSTGGLCPHHQEHSYEVCSYIKAAEGHPCSHVHDRGCGYVEAVPEVPCDKGCADTDRDGQIDHVEDCAYTPPPWRALSAGISMTSCAAMWKP